MTKILETLFLCGLWTSIFVEASILDEYTDSLPQTSSTREVRRHQFEGNHRTDGSTTGRYSQSKTLYKYIAGLPHNSKRSRNTRRIGNKVEDKTKNEENLKSWMIAEDLLESRRFNDDLRSNQKLVEYREDTKGNVVGKSSDDSRLVEYNLQTSGEDPVSYKGPKRQFSEMKNIRDLQNEDSSSLTNANRRMSLEPQMSVRSQPVVLESPTTPSSTCMQPPSLDNSVIYAAVLLTNSSEYTISLSKVQLVLRLAEEEVIRRQLLPRNLSFQFLLKDDRCDAMYSQRATFEAVKQNVNVFFGPACEYSVGEYEV